MKVTATPSPFGSRARTRTLIALQLLTETYARELARLLDMSLSSIQKALGSLERDGLIAGRDVGRTRLYRVNPRAFARQELQQYLGRLSELETSLRKRTTNLRRRPRRTGKPL